MRRRGVEEGVEYGCGGGMWRRGVQALLRGRHGRVGEEPTAVQLDQGHAHRHLHVDHALHLLQGPVRAGVRIRLRLRLRVRVRVRAGVRVT